MNFPIYGGITTKRGIYYRYAIFSNHSVEVWKKVVVPDLHNGGPTARKEKSVFVKPTKEIKERLSKEYGFTVS